MKGGRKYGKKPSKLTVNKAKKMVTKVHKARAKKNMDTFFLRARYSGVITPQQGATVSNFIYFSPSLLAGGADWNIQNNTEFRLYASLYDRFRVNTVRLIYTPKANVLDATIGQNDAAYTLTGDNMVHTAIDRDGKIPANILRMIRYPSYRKFSCLKKFSRSYSIKWPKGVWLDCNDLTTPTNDALLARLGAYGGITLYAENLIEDKLEIFNEPLADIALEYDVVFEGKTSASIAVDLSGNVMIKPDTSNPVVPTGTTTVLQGSIYGDKRYDLSGNLVTVKDTDLP